MALKNDPTPEPGSNPNPGAFDPAAFRTELMAELNKAVNGAIKGLKNELKASQPKPEGDTPSGDPTPEPKPAPNPAIDPAVNAELQSLRKQLQQAPEQIGAVTKERETERTARLETERTTAVRDVLNGIPFKDQAKRDLFFRATIGDIKRDDQGKLVAETDNGLMPADAYLKSLVEQESYQDMLAPKGSGGAGARNGSPTMQVGGRRWTMADLTPEKVASLKPEEQASLAQAVANGQVAT